MPHTIDPDKLFPIAAAPREVEQLTGDRPHISTVHRWRQRGRYGVRLRTQMGCGGRRTCRRWLKEFFDAVTAAADQQEQQAVGLPVATASARSRHEQAERELAAAGM